MRQCNSYTDAAPGLLTDCYAQVLFPTVLQKYVTVHTAHGAVTLAFEDSAEAQLWFAALKDVVTTLKQVTHVACVGMHSIPFHHTMCRQLGGL